MDFYYNSCMNNATSESLKHYHKLQTINNQLKKEEKEAFKT